MYDIITCEYPLPLPEEAKDLEFPPNWQTKAFQTKSFDSVLMDYSIEEDGQIYRTVVDRELVQREDGTLKFEEIDQGIERVDHTGEIKFYTVLLEDKFDYWVEFTALYWKGDLKEISLSKWEKMDNSERVEIESQTKKQLEKFEQKEKRPWQKFKRGITPLVRGALFLIRWPIGQIARLTWKIERWLT